MFYECKVTDRSHVSGWGAIFSSIDSRCKLYMRSSILSIQEIGAWWGAQNLRPQHSFEWC